MRFSAALFFATGEAFQFNVAPAPLPNLPRDTPLQIETLPDTIGSCEKKAVNTDMVKVHYTGWALADGIKFDSSYDRKSPLDFKLGARQVISGVYL